MTSENRRLTARLSAIAFASALLFGCGGGNETAPAASASGAPTEAVQMADTATALSVRVPSTSTGTTAPMVLAQTQYTFAATFASGPHAGQKIEGLLLLKSEEDDGMIEVEGRLLPSTTSGSTVASADAQSQAQAQALQTQLQGRLEALRTTFKADIKALSETLRQAVGEGSMKDNAAALTAAQRTALQKFKDAFAARSNQFQSDMSAATLDVRSQLEVLGVMPAGKGGDADERDGRRGYKVKGTISADGKVDLTLTAGDRSVVHVMGQQAAGGSMTGSFTGPAGSD